MLSDFMTEGYENTLKIVGTSTILQELGFMMGHDEEIPNLGMVPMLGCGVTAKPINTSSKRVRKNIKPMHFDWQITITLPLKKGGAGTIDTQESSKNYEEIRLFQTQVQLMHK